MSDPINPSTMGSPDQKGSGCGVLFLSSILAPLIAHFVVGNVFGRERVSSASLWGLAPIAHVFFFTLCLPVLWLAYGASLAFWRRGANPPESSALWAAVTATLVYLLAVCVLWWLRGAHKIPLSV